jgi:hypothetical protein
MSLILIKAGRDDRVPDDHAAPAGHAGMSRRLRHTKPDDNIKITR